MEGILYLTSSGFLGELHSQTLNIISKHFKDKKVLFVDNATTTGSNVAGKEEIKQKLTDFGCNLTILTLKSDNLSQIYDFDAIYITGGDLTPLIELANSTNLKDILYKYLEQGGIIVGESAGSMIFGKDLRWAYAVKRGTKEKWNVQLESYVGLGIVDINFFPHWNKVSDELKDKAKKYEKDHNLKLTRVIDGEYISVYFSDLLRLNK